jgi:hypothetical protein
VGFYIATFEVLTEDLCFKRSVQSTAVSNVNWGLCREQEDVMKSMAVTYVHDMVHESYSYSNGIMSPSPRVQWQGRKFDRSLPSGDEIVNVWSSAATDSN